MTAPPGDQRAAELASSLAAVRARIHAATQQAQRPAGAVSLVVVTKFFPASDVRLLAGLGVADVGENRHQEAQGKAHECADLRGGLRWHFIGGLQSNKAAAVAAYADVVESLDRPKLVAPLDRGAAERGVVLPVLVQVSLDPSGATRRAGAEPTDVLGLAERVEQAEHLELAGLMAVAPLGEEPVAAFARLAEVQRALLAEHPAASVLSAGMSADLEAAIGAGATHVRVGSAVLGSRPAVQ